MTHRDLQQFLDIHGVEATILTLDEHTETVSAAARVLGVETDQIIKSLVFTVADTPLLVINNGLARIDRRKLAVALGVGRRQVKFAELDRVLVLTGYEVGSMPPFGHREKLRTLIDPAVLERDEIFGGGGSRNAMLRLTATELVRMTA
ncbi:MAG: YbaK/EbsC family protein, partial [Deferrisomatales bacterium]|nr:YbaK/EbsC family protein [Deferrisomatales bacterium]